MKKIAFALMTLFVLATAACPGPAPTTDGGGAEDAGGGGGGDAGAADAG